MNMKKISVCAIALSSILSASAFAETLSGSLVYKDKSDALVVKTGSVEIDLQNISKVKLMLKGEAEEVAQKARVKKFQTEGRTVVVAAFRNIRNLPEGTSLIIKANLLTGNNGKVMYGDVFTRSCEKGFAAEITDQDSALERLIYGVRERRGCELMYRGGILLNTVQAENAFEGDSEG